MKRTTNLSRISKRPKKRPSRVPLVIAATSVVGVGTSILVLLSLLVTTGVAAYRYYQSVVPDGIQQLISYEEQPYQVSLVADRNGNVLQDLVDPGLGIREIVPLSRIPRDMITATIDTENRTFYSDPGVDPVRLFKAGVHDVNGSSGLQGASTLTQQLVKLALFGTDPKGGRGLNSGAVSRKLQEIAVAVGATQRFKKDGILEMYLNTVPYGTVIYGVQAAAKYYFGKDISRLDLAQCALLAGLPQDPPYYDPQYHRASALARQHDVLAGMLAQKDITQAQYDAALAEPLHFVFKSLVQHSATHTVESYFVQWLVNTYLSDPRNLAAFHLPDLKTSSDVYRGFIFDTTLDPALQQMAQQTVDDQVSQLGYLNVQDGALVAIDPRSSEIKAMVGGIGYDAPISGAQFNMAWEYRQPGSSFKPFMYVTSFAHGHFPGETIMDAYVSYPNGGDNNTPYVPHNYDLGYHGAVTLRQALANSYNVPAVKTLYNLVPDGSGNVARNIKLVLKTTSSFGYHVETQDLKKLGLAFTLGTDRGRLLEEVNAYSVFANNGIYRPYMPILRIYRRCTGGKTPQCPDGQKKLIWQYHAPQGTQVIAPQFAYLITSVLSDVPAKVPAFGDYAYSYLSLADGQPMASKTGTTSDFKDNLTLGYTPDLVTGVWVGNPDNTPMTGSTGITGAAPIFHQFMTQALANTPIHDFIQPTGIITATVARAAPPYALPGLATSGYGVQDIFAAGTVPRSFDQPGQDSYTGATSSPGSQSGTSGVSGTSPTQNNPCGGGYYTYSTVIVNGQTQYRYTCK